MVLLEKKQSSKSTPVLSYRSDTEYSFVSHAQVTHRLRADYAQSTHRVRADNAQITPRSRHDHAQIGEDTVGVSLFSKALLIWTVGVQRFVLVGSSPKVVYTFLTLTLSGLKYPLRQ